MYLLKVGGDKILTLPMYSPGPVKRLKDRRNWGTGGPPPPIVTDQLTLFQPGRGQNMPTALLFATHPTGFTNLPTALVCYATGQSMAWCPDCSCVPSGYIPETK